MFGSVYLWSAVILTAAIVGLTLWIRPRLETTGWLRVVDLSLMAILAGIALQIAPLPAAVVSVISPARLSFIRQASLDGHVPALVPLTLDRGATLHAWLVTFCAAATFWNARALFARGGTRLVITTVAAGAVLFVLVAFAQASAATKLVYGFWHPFDAGARPLGPFINRNHAGTWSVLALFLCFGCFQWRRASTSPSRGWSWRARVAHALNGRSLVLVLAITLLVVSVAAGASRSAMLALACGAGYVAFAAPRREGTAASSIWTGAIALAAAFAVIAYADVDRLLSRVDETRQLGLAQRVAIWRDTLGVIRDFPVAGAGAGNFSHVMRLYQTNDRTYFWNEAHNHYLQVAAEGGVLLALPAALALIGVTAAGVSALRRRDDAAHWLRLGAAAALIAVAVQSFWETGLTLPASGMLAAVAAAILVHTSRHGSNAASRS